MKTERYSKPAGSNGSGQKDASYGEFKDRDLAGMSPEKAQEALQPTEAEPVRMHARMAGCS